LQRELQRRAGALSQSVVISKPPAPRPTTALKKLSGSEAHRIAKNRMYADRRHRAVRADGR
jgi:hypothetical protein